MASRASRPSALIASLALASLAIAPLFGAACGSNAEGPTDGGAEASVAEAGDAGEDAFDFLLDSSIGARCTMGNHSDPVGLCIQKLAILGEHAEFSTLTGMPSAWSVDTLLPDTDDGGATPIHDARDDVAYGASLADYYASAMAYGDMDSIGIVTGDMDGVAQLLETELSPLPADYDGTLYMRLRHLAAGLRLAGFANDGNAIDVIATSYGRAIYTSYYHALGPTLPPPDAGSDANVGDDGGAEDASTDATTVDATVDAATEDASTSDASALDAGSTPPAPSSEGILGVAADGGIAYESDKAASGALALVDMAARASGLSIPLEDGGVDAAAPDPTDALVWSQAAASVFNHLASAAHDTTGLYYTQLLTDEYSRDDTVTDDGSFLTQTQGGVALAYVRAARLVTLAGLKTPNAETLTEGALSIAVAAQTPTPTLASLSLWDNGYQAVTLAACTSPTPLTSCGSGFFTGLNGTKTALNAGKGITGNALMLDAIHRTSVAVNAFDTNYPLEANDLPPLTALFAYVSPDLEDAGVNVSFFSQASDQAGFVEYVTAGLLLPEAVEEDGGLGIATYFDGAVLPGAFAYPLARYYTAGATAAAIEGMNDLWVGEPGAPTFFQ